MPLSDILYDSDSSNGESPLNALWGFNATNGAGMTNFEQFKTHPDSVFNEIDMRLKNTLMETRCIRFDRICAINRWVDDLIEKIRDIVNEEEMRIKNLFDQFQQTYELEMMEAGRRALENVDTSSDENDNEQSEKPDSPTDKTTEAIVKRFEAVERGIGQMVFELENLKLNWRPFIENKINKMETQIEDASDKTLLVIFAVGALTKICNRLEYVDDMPERDD